MLEVSKKRHGIKYSYVWFADEPSVTRAFSPVVYMQCQRKGAVTGYQSQPFYTLLIDLCAEPEAILNEMSKTTSYEIKRATRDGIVMMPVVSAHDVIAFYNAFAESKSRAAMERTELFGWGEQTVAFAAVNPEGETLAMHTYVVDRQTCRVRLLHSASQFRRMQNSVSRNAVGRANRYLHYAEMLHFKESGFVTYDLGGYAKDCDDREIVTIAHFKKGFGGQLVREDRYVSAPMRFMQVMGHTKQRLRRLAKRVAKQARKRSQDQLPDNAVLSAGMTSPAKRSI